MSTAFVEMTLDDAIRHALDEARSGGSRCSLEHMQLATWLTELRERRKEEHAPRVQNAAPVDALTAEDLTAEEVVALCGNLENQVYPAKDPARRAFKKLLEVGASGAGLKVVR